MNYEEKILTALVDNYRSSRKDAGDNKTSRRTQIKPEKIYKLYNSNKGDFDEIAEVNGAVEKMIDLGFVTADKEKFGTRIITIYLVDSKITDIETYLGEKYKYVSKDTKLELLQSVILKYEKASPICTKECELLNEKLNRRQIPKNLEELNAIFVALAFVENNQEKLYIREVSLKLYGDSKEFENTTLQPVCGLLHKYSDENDCNGNEIYDEILTRYHIYKEPQKISLKGPACISINGIDTDISGFEDGIEFSVSDLSNIDDVKIIGDYFMTIENRTSYLRYKNDETVIFYLGGYANRDQRDLITKIIKDNPDKEYLHFGDIDAGGFWIHHNLCAITGREFELFSMSEKELSNPEYESCLHPLSSNDINRLQELEKQEVYRPVVRYMLKNNVKLEQEIISFNLMKK